MDRFGIEEDQPIEHRLVSRAIENAQRRVEAHNFEIRKHLLEYDNVMNQQREVIYSQRREVLAGRGSERVGQEMIEEQAEGIVDLFADEKVHPEEWDLKGLQDAVYQQFSFRWTPPSAEEDGFNRERLKELVIEKAQGGLREEGRGIRSAHAPIPGEGDHASVDRLPLERPSPRHRSVEGRDRIERIWPEEPPALNIKRGLPDVP